jgi:hypothetical protein
MFKSTISDLLIIINFINFINFTISTKVFFFCISLNLPFVYDSAETLRELPVNTSAAQDSRKTFFHRNFKICRLPYFITLSAK